ncbi:MAG: GspE/PulE/PilB domain-containing protein [Candidatus Geothermincolia bacterium]
MNARRRSGDKPLLGEILLDQGLLTEANLAQVLRVQAGGQRRVGYLLVKMKFISDVQLLDAISTQLGVPVVQVEKEIRGEAQMLLPRHLCRRFTVLPLALEKNNVVRLAMVDPLDDVAIREVENFTGLVVRPVLANVHDIRDGIERHVPFSSRDLFNPHVYKIAAKFSAAAAVALILAVSYLTYNKVQLTETGTKKRGADSVSYRHLELKVDVFKDGSISFNGRAAHADGTYGVRFANAEGMKAFLNRQKTLLSEAQQKWLSWVLTDLSQDGSEAFRGQPARAAGVPAVKNDPG